MEIASRNKEIDRPNYDPVPMSRDMPGFNKLPFLDEVEEGGCEHAYMIRAIADDYKGGWVLSFRCEKCGAGRKCSPKECTWFEEWYLRVTGLWELLQKNREGHEPPRQS